MRAASAFAACTPSSRMRSISACTPEAGFLVCFRSRRASRVKNRSEVNPQSRARTRMRTPRIPQQRQLARSRARTLRACLLKALIEAAQQLPWWKALIMSASPVRKPIPKSPGAFSIETASTRLRVQRDNNPVDRLRGGHRGDADEASRGRSSTSSMAPHAA